MGTWRNGGERTIDENADPLFGGRGLPRPVIECLRLGGCSRPAVLRFRRHVGTVGQVNTDEQEWDARYRESDRIWSGNPNDVLLREVPGLAVGAVLDLGCGEGADAIWLAQQGWQVTAVDISGVAIERGKEHAQQQGMAERVSWQRHDLSRTFPAGEFDLVVSFFLHSWRDLPRASILRRAAAAVAPGGVLLVVGHSSGPPGEHNHHPEIHLPGPQEVLDGLGLAEDEWEVLVVAEHERIQVIDGEKLTRTDNAVKVRRQE